VEQSSGLVIAAEGDRAAYLPADDVIAFRELVSHVLRRPSVAGPPLDRASFENLASTLESGVEAAVGSAEAEALTLLRDQIALRETLPLRIRPTCSACGLAGEKLVNPSKPKPGRTGEISDTIISTVDMAVDHPVLAVVRLMGGVGKLRAGAASDIPVCERCDGVEFDSVTVTFCPACRAMREESILLVCPDCQAAFRPPAKRPSLWLSVDEARARWMLETHRARFEAGARDVENGLYADQKQFLLNAMIPDDEPLGLLRCGRPGDTIRGVVVLITTRQLVSAYQLMTSKITGSVLTWDEVVGVREMGARGQQSLEIHLPDRPALILNRIKGNGVRLGSRAIDFSSSGLHQLACELADVPYEPWRDPAPPMAVPVSPSPMPLSPAPAPPPQPPLTVGAVPPGTAATLQTAPPPKAPAYMGWYPDPWRMARMRWWDGQRWTEHLQP
jgi:hypothetical protein